MTIAPTTGRWRVLARTRGGHTVLLDHRLSEEEARRRYSDYVDTLSRHSSPVPVAISDYLLEGDFGVVRIHALEAVHINEDRTVTGR